LSLQAFRAYSNKKANLLRKLVNYDHKKFYRIGPCGQFYKTFFVRNLRIVILSEHVCPWQPFRAYSNKQANLL
jgi:hypothetical protein